MENLRQIDPDIADAVQQEAWREDGVLEMIASENHTYPEILEAQGSVLTNKYAEGYPGKRYYGGCEYVDEIEELAIDRVKKLFNAEHANVQPHSGTQANMAVYFSCLDPGDKILGMELSHGGHLSHGHPANFSGKLYEVESYKVDEDTGRIDYDEVEKKAKEFKPDLIISGASAYPREINYKRFGEIAQEIDAYHIADIAHPAGLVAANIHQNPIDHADFVTSTTQKTLRGPRGGFILCSEEFSDEIDSEVFPGIQGGPLMHVIAAKAVCFKKALEKDFKDYQNSIIQNSKALASTLQEHGWNLVSGGTDSHIVLIDLRGEGITGKKAEEALEEVDIVANKNTIPGETRSPTVTSGLRLGTSCLTARGIKEKETKKIGELISQVLSNPDNNSIKQTVKKEVEEICEEFPIYPSLEIWID